MPGKKLAVTTYNNLYSYENLVEIGITYRYTSSTYVRRNEKIPNTVKIMYTYIHIIWSGEKKYEFDRKSRNCNKTKLQISLEFFQSFRGAVLYTHTLTNLFFIIIDFFFQSKHPDETAYVYTRVYILIRSIDGGLCRFGNSNNNGVSAT